MKKTNSKSVKPTNELTILKSEEFGQVKVVSDDKAEGYVCLNDLCGILNLPKKEIIEKLLDHLYTVSAKDARGTKHEMDFVDESGLYLMYVMSKKKNAIRFQEWLHDKFLQPLHEQQKQNIGKYMDDKLVIETYKERLALRYIANAHNVAKSGHFRTGKDIPELTMSHLRGWWHNPNDQSTFMLQFNCKSDLFIKDNIRMNVYLSKGKDENTEVYDMFIKFVDLDDNNREFHCIAAWMPSYVVSDNAILDYIMEELTMDGDILKQRNIDLVLILNGTMSFHRSRRV